MGNYESLEREVRRLPSPRLLPFNASQDPPAWRPGLSLLVSYRSLALWLPKTLDASVLHAAGAFVLNCLDSQPVLPSAAAQQCSSSASAARRAQHNAAQCSACSSHPQPPQQPPRRRDV